MYLGVILMCGLNPVFPGAIEGCIAVPSNRIFSELRECQESLIPGVDVVLQRAPPGVFVSSAECYVIARDQ